MRCTRWRGTKYCAPPSCAPHPSDTLLNRALVDTHHCAQEFKRIFLLALERIAANDRAETTTIANGTGLVEELFIGGVATTGENHNSTPVERALDNMVDTLCQRRDGNFVLLV